VYDVEKLALDKESPIQGRLHRNGAAIFDA
jgi:hypothetical protein